ncbi:helix-turn-helix domain-containing protein [Fluviicola taffensis]|uniref:Helix-turn-helix domain protein n=1 Tax=Fluviicola taffensis (strain DSM 16823 / NCIMB 13979 / RW262) TaxID=755732 RepID=F2I9U0_FLUTR|nr:helix-turn-helix transcriptional regulator [Fluviicola taffensis]AEA43086.1 helix-turn-helix domain protein [Fluviicola taffensis DSM 16823]
MNSALDDEKLLRLAERVRELRISKGLTQNDAFADTGIHFGRIEQGKRDISFTTLCKLADYFEINLESFR